MNADVFHEVGEDQAILMTADERDTAPRPEEGLDLRGTEQRKEDLIMPETVDELLRGIGIGDVGPGSFTPNFDPEHPAEGDEGA